MSLIIGKQPLLGLNYIYMRLLRHIYKKTEVVIFSGWAGFSDRISLLFF